MSRKKICHSERSEDTERRTGLHIQLDVLSPARDVSLDSSLRSERRPCGCPEVGCLLAALSGVRASSRPTGEIYFKQASGDRQTKKNRPHMRWRWNQGSVERLTWMVPFRTDFHSGLDGAALDLGQKSIEIIEREGATDALSRGCGRRSDGSSVIVSKAASASPNGVPFSTSFPAARRVRYRDRRQKATAARRLLESRSNDRRAREKPAPMKWLSPNSPGDLDGPFDRPYVERRCGLVRTLNTVPVTRTEPVGVRR